MLILSRTAPNIVGRSTSPEPESESESESSNESTSSASSSSASASHSESERSNFEVDDNNDFPDAPTEDHDKVEENQLDLTEPVYEDFMPDTGSALSTATLSDTGATLTEPTSFTTALEKIIAKYIADKFPSTTETDDSANTGAVVAGASLPPADKPAGSKSKRAKLSATLSSSSTSTPDGGSSTLGKHKKPTPSQPVAPAPPTPVPHRHTNAQQRRHLTQISKSLSQLTQRVNKALENV